MYRIIVYLLLFVLLQVARESDLGGNDITYRVRTHLGHLLQAGDSVQGYDLTRATLDDGVVDTLIFQCPDVILIKKVYPEQTKKASKKHKRRTRRGKAKQEKPVVLEDENEADLDLIMGDSTGNDTGGATDSLVPTIGVMQNENTFQSKKILTASVFGWTGGDDEEYQAFNRRLDFEDQEDENHVLVKEVSKVEGEEIDADFDETSLLGTGCVENTE